MNIRPILAAVLISGFAAPQTRAQAPTAPAPAIASQTITVNVLGAVNKPSRLILPAGGTVLDALASAGGATKSGNLSKVNVIQKTTGDKPKVVAIDLKQILNGAAKDVVLRDGDTLFIGETIF